METKLVKLKTDFNNIINVRTTVKNIFDILQNRINKLKILYAEFIKTSKNKMFVFGLDSFHFQSKLIDIEYDDMQRLFLAINNRMYCEYFKLYKIITEYITANVSDKNKVDTVTTKNYPVYKDLEPFKEYKFEFVLEIHENILNLLSILISTLNNKENELLLHKNKQNIGLNIDNFITTFNYNIIVMREKIVMFITYIEFFHKLHIKYLKRFANKIQLMYSHISNDIQFDENVDMNKKGTGYDTDTSNPENDVLQLPDTPSEYSTESIHSQFDKLDVQINLLSETREMELVLEEDTTRIEVPCKEENDEPLKEEKDEPCKEKDEEEPEQKQLDIVEFSNISQNNAQHKEDKEDNEDKEDKEDKNVNNEWFSRFFNPLGSN